MFMAVVCVFLSCSTVACCLIQITINDDDDDDDKELVVHLYELVRNSFTRFVRVRIVVLSHL